MSWLKNILRRIMPNDDGPPVCGYGPFSLPASHPLTPGCVLHDEAFRLAEQGIPESTLNDADVALFWRWAMIAHNQPTTEDQIELILDICKYWPLARLGGKILWDGKD